MNQEAVQAVTVACAMKFATPSELAPLTSDTPASLAPIEIEALTFRPTTLSGNLFVGILYNGSSEKTLTSVEIMVTTSEQGKSTSKIYRSNVSVPPRAASDVSFFVLRGDQRASYECKIVGATGVARDPSPQ